MSTLLITGTGSLARRIMHRWRDRYDKIVAYSRCEYKHSTLPSWVTSEIGDVRDYERLQLVFDTHFPTTVVHSSALKRVDTLEQHPLEAVRTNILGTENVARLSMEYNVDKSILISTDKCVRPAQVYGATKLIARAIYADYAKRSAKTSFLCCLYGNVVKSRGSFIPLWEKNIENDLPIYITHKDCTRFMFSLDDSVDLIEHTLEHAHNGETFIPIMDSFYVMDVAKAIGLIHGRPNYHNVHITNKLRPGEKLHEEMLSDLDLSKTFNTPVDRVVAVSPYWFDEVKENRTPYEGPVIRSDLFINKNMDDLVNLIQRSTVDVQP